MDARTSVYEAAVNSAGRSDTGSGRLFRDLDAIGLGRVTVGIADHTTVGTAGRVLYKSARYFKYAGRTLLVVGIALDVYSVVKADKPLRQAAKVVSGWAGAWVGCKVVGDGGAWVGTAVTPGVGTAVGGVVGCIAGGFIGYEGASRAAGRLYDWGEASFTAVPETAGP